MPGRATGAGLVVVAVVLAGCAAPAADDGWTTPVVGPDVPDFTAGSALPFDAFHHDEAQLAAMQAAEVGLLRDCAQRYGVDATYSGDYLRPDDLARAMWGGRPGTLDADHAGRFGYHASDASPWAPVGGFYLKDPSNILPPPDASGDSTALVTFGPAGDEGDAGDAVPVGADGEPLPPGGCLREVERTIGGPLVSDTDITAELVELSFRHPAVVDAVGAWSRCMADAGHPYDRVQDPGESFSLALLTPQEVEVALADVGCTEVSRWDDVFYAVLGDYEQQAVDRHRADFVAVQRSQAARLAALGVPSG